MRIRRRPQAQSLIPSALLHQHPSDPSTAPPQPPPPSNSPQHWLPGKEEASKSGELHRPSVDLGVVPSRPPPRRISLPSHPQGNNVVGRSENLSSGGGGAQRQGAAKAYGSHRDKPEWLVIGAGEERLVFNGVIPVTSPTAAMHAKEVIKSDGTKRRRGPALLLEGSRCSRVNGRGWRCSQPTLVGYSLCEHHLGKGRQSRSASGGAGRSIGGPKLGRTEPASGSKSSVPLPDGTEPAARLMADPFA